MSELTKFNTLEEMIKAKGQLSHENNLNYGGVFDKNDNRISNLSFEVEYAAKKVGHISASYAPFTLGFDLSEDAYAAKYIKNFGYVELFA